MFEEVFWEIAEREGIDEWYELFDSELFYEVEEEIARRAGLHWTDEDDLYLLLCDNVEGFEEWYNEMTEDL